MGVGLLSKEDSQTILALVKKEPCLIQDLARALDKSWVTTESYVNQISRDTGLIKTKAFRQGTRGAIKIVYWNYAEATQDSEVRAKLFERIKLTSDKTDFDPLEIFQFVNPAHSRAFVEPFFSNTPELQQKLIRFFDSVKDELLVLSGNLSFLRDKPVLDAFVDLVSRGVRTKVVCRVDLASVDTLKRIDFLLSKYPDRIEIRHSRQPVRGFIADQKIVRLKDEKRKSQYKESELENDLIIFYEIFDSTWVNWFSNVFWYLYRTSLNYHDRLKTLENLKID